MVKYCNTAKPDKGNLYFKNLSISNLNGIYSYLIDVRFVIESNVPKLDDFIFQNLIILGKLY